MSALVALNLEQPRTRRRRAAVAKKPVGPSSERAYTRNLQDTYRSFWLDTVDQDRVITARRTANLQGNMAFLADIIALMRCIDPTIKAARSQRISGVTSTPWAITPADDSNEAAQYADEFDTMLRRPEVGFDRYLEGAVDKRLEGGGLIENVWNDPNESGPRYIQEFATLPLQRLRYDRTTGIPAFAPRTIDWWGKPVSDFEPGKFSVFLVDEDILDFGERGTYRTILSDWYGRMQVFSWWLQGIERYGLPFIVGQSDNATERDNLKTNLRDLGSLGALITGAATKIEAKYQDFQQGRNGSAHQEFMLRTDQRIFLAFLGESQTGIIENRAGSQQSSNAQREVAKDVLQADWRAIEKVVRKDIAAPWTMANHGVEKLALTPFLRADIRDSVDLVAFGQGVELALKNGVPDLPVDWYRDIMRAPKATEGQEVLKAPAPPPAMSPFGALSAVPADGQAASRRKRQASLFDQMDQHLSELDHVADRYTRKGSRAMTPLFDLIQHAAADDDMETVKRQLIGLTDTIAAASLEAAMQGVEAGKAQTETLSK